MDDQQNISSTWPGHLLLSDHNLLRYFNSTEEYLAYFYAPKRSRLSLPMTLVYAAIFLVGVSGNMLVCMVILKHHNMRTPTNYYLFSLAVSDLLVLLLGMPFEVYEMWSNYPFLFGVWGCYFKTVLFETVCFASILSVTTVSVERYVAIIHPFQAKLKSTRRRALRILITLWIFSILFSIPNTSTHGIHMEYFPNGSLVPDSATCTVVQPLWIYNCIIQVTSLLFYVLPMGVISVLYCLMGLKPYSSQISILNSSAKHPPEKSHLHSKPIQLVKMNMTCQKNILYTDCSSDFPSRQDSNTSRQMSVGPSPPQANPTGEDEHDLSEEHLIY